MTRSKLNRRDVLSMPLAALAAPVLARSALAQPKYPDHPIRLVIPFPPGGVYDAVGRPWADRVKAQLGSVVIENMGGAGGSLGAAAVARAAPDGYTMLLGGGGPFVVNPLASSHLTYDPIRDFSPISLVAVTALSFIVNPNLPVHNLKELIAYAKANPGKLSYGSAGVGSFNHLTGELFKSLIGAPDITHVPYRGAGQAITDVVSGQIPLATPNVTGQVLELHKTGKLRILAVTTPKPIIAAPDIPAAVDTLPKMISHNYLGLYVPAGTSNAIVEQIAQATRMAMAQRELQQLYVASGFEPMLDSSPEKLRQFLNDEIARWAPVIKAIGLKLD